MMNRYSRDRTETVVEKNDRTKDFQELESSLQIVRSHIVLTVITDSLTGESVGRGESGAP